MDLSNIYELWDRFDRSDVVEMELDMNGAHFHLKSASSMKETEGTEVSARSKRSGNAVDLSKNKNIQMEEEAEVAPIRTDFLKNDKEFKTVKAPLVGTFYQASSPDAEPYVKVGQEIHKGDVIGIVEAMKLMNEVVADVDGKIVEILAQDGMMVEYDQPLIILE